MGNKIVQRGEIWRTIDWNGVYGNTIALNRVNFREGCCDVDD